MAYHLSDIEIIHEINENDTAEYPKLHMAEMN